MKNIFCVRNTRFSFAIVVAIAVTIFSAREAKSAVPEAALPAVISVEVTGHGNPMILIPGLASDGTVWESTVAHYAANYECHVVTLAGFAGKPAVQGDMLDQAEKALSTYIVEHHLKNPVIVGHSLGGYLGLRLAEDHPEQVGRLVIVDSLPALGATTMPDATPAQLEKAAARMRDGLLAADPASRAARSRQAIQSMVSNPADVDRIQGWGVASDPQTVAAAMYDIMASDLRPNLPQIHAPTLVMGTWIAFKDYAPRTAIEATFKEQYRGLSQMKFAMADTSRHFIMYDDPSWMFAQMDAFLK